MKELTSEITSEMRGRAVRLRQICARVALGNHVDVDDFAKLGIAREKQQRQSANGMWDLLVMVCR